MAEKSDGPVDLFGDPLGPYRDPRGRKPHRRVPQIAEKVAVLKATGSSDDQIAQRIGLSLPTLRKYYFRELDKGGDLARQVLVERMWQKALEGNVSAAKFIRDELPKGAAEEFDRQVQSPRPGRAAPIGKKEARLAAAAEIDDPDFNPGLAH